MEALKRVLLLNSLQLYELFTMTIKGKLAPGLDIEHISIPPDIQAKVLAIQRQVSQEMFPVPDAAEQRMVGEPKPV